MAPSPPPAPTQLPPPQSSAVQFRQSIQASHLAFSDHLRIYSKADPSKHLGSFRISVVLTSPAHAAVLVRIALLANLNRRAFPQSWSRTPKMVRIRAAGEAGRKSPSLSAVRRYLKSLVSAGDVLLMPPPSELSHLLVQTAHALHNHSPFTSRSAISQGGEAAICGEEVGPETLDVAFLLSDGRDWESLAKMEHSVDGVRLRMGAMSSEGSILAPSWMEESLFVVATNEGVVDEVECGTALCAWLDPATLATHHQWHTEYILVSPMSLSSQCGCGQLAMNSARQCDAWQDDDAEA